MHEVLINRLGGLSLPKKRVVRLTDRPDMTFDVYRGRKTTIQQQQSFCMDIFLMKAIGKYRINKKRNGWMDGWMDRWMTCCVDV